MQVLQYGAKSIGTWSVRTHCNQPTTIHTEIFKRSDWLMSTDPVPILLAPYCNADPSSSGNRQHADQTRTSVTTRQADQTRTSVTTRQADQTRTSVTTQHADQTRTSVTTRQADQTRTSVTTQHTDQTRSSHRHRHADKALNNDIIFDLVSVYTLRQD
jgi:hypothetical protein